MVMDKATKKILLIGTGLASYGACIALLEKKNIIIDVVDIGLKEAYKNQPNIYVPNAKDKNGSYFAYGINDNRWSLNIQSDRICSSHAYGGFSQAYSGSILKPKEKDMKDWPEKSLPNIESYKKILSTLDINQKFDELDLGFPINPSGDDNKLKKNSYLGMSRIAISNIDRKADVPFLSSIEFDKWSKENLINLKRECFVSSIQEHKKKLHVTIETIDGTIIKEYDHVYLGAGCINTTAIVDRSLYGFGSRNYIIKSAPFLLQLCLKLKLKKYRKTQPNKTRLKDDYGLCKYFLEVKSKSTKGYWSHTQIGYLNKIIIQKAKNMLPKKLQSIVDLLKGFFRFSITVFHSELGEDILITSKVTNREGTKTKQYIKVNEKSFSCNWKLSLAIKKEILKRFKNLSLIPIPFSQMIGSIGRGNKLGGWHFGGTLPMKVKPVKSCECKENGELVGINKLFIIDSSSFPSIPGSTVALLTMANSYYITRKSI